LVFNSSVKPVTLITDDGSGITQSLRNKLDKEGHITVILNLNHKFSRKKNLANTITLSESTDLEIENALMRINEKFGKVDYFMHMHPIIQFEENNISMHFNDEKEIVQSVFLLAKHLNHNLADSENAQRSGFLAITQFDGKFGTGGKLNTSVIGGGLSGLVKSLNLEWPSVFCRSIDIQPEIKPNKAAELIFDELYDVDVNNVDIGISEKGRTTYSTQETQIDESEIIEANLSDNSLFIVSGGGRGVTASCIIELARNYKCKFILIGRSSIKDELPNYAIEEENEGKLKTLIMNDLKSKGEKANIKTLQLTYNKIVAKKEIDKTIKSIEENGGKAVYIQADVTNLKIKTQLSKIEKEWGSITGLIHGAGRLADKLIQNKTEEDFNNVFSVKIDGIVNLLNSVNLNKLQHLVLFSSVAGFYGNIGQTDYAIANEILNTLAHLIKANYPLIKVSAINWGAWEGGMVSPELQKKFEEQGVTLVNKIGGVAMFVNEFSKKYNSQPQVIIGGTLPKPESVISNELKVYKVKRKLSELDNPFLNHHKLKGKPVLPTVISLSWMADTCLGIYPDFIVTTINNARVFNGIIFTDTKQENYFLELKELTKSVSRIEFEVVIFSEGNKFPKNHYSANIILEKVYPTYNLNNDFNKSIDATNGIKGEQLYQNGVLFHGPYFQGIQEVLNINEDEMILKCNAKQIPLEEQGQFPIRSINTYVLDILYQSLLVWVHKFKDGARSLPLQSEYGKLFINLPFEKELYIHFKIREHSDYKMIADGIIYDNDGNVYIEIGGTGVTVSKELSW